MYVPKGIWFKNKMIWHTAQRYTNASIIAYYTRNSKVWGHHRIYHFRQNNVPLKTRKKLWFIVGYKYWIVLNVLYRAALENPQECEVALINSSSITNIITSNYIYKRLHVDYVTAIYEIVCYEG